MVIPLRDREQPTKEANPARSQAHPAGRAPSVSFRVRFLVLEKFQPDRSLAASLLIGCGSPLVIPILAPRSISLTHPSNRVCKRSISPFLASIEASVVEQLDERLCELTSLRCTDLHSPALSIVLPLHINNLAPLLLPLPHVAKEFWLHSLLQRGQRRGRPARSDHRLPALLYRLVM